jgi:two-component system, cell cycle sensor histidine kinase and response regulator CckA
VKDERKRTPLRLALLALAVIPFLLVSRLQAASPEQAPAFSPAVKPSRIIVTDDALYAPFSYLDLNGKPAGITIDIWKSLTGKPPMERISWSIVQFLGAMVAAILIIILLWNINLRKTVAKALYEAEQRHRELKDNEARFRAFFDLSPFSSVVTDRQGRFQMANHAFCSRMGLKEKDVVGHTAEELGFSFNGNTTETLIKELEDGSEIINREVIFSAPDRGPRYALLSCRLLAFGGEKLVLVSTMDITERKLAEEALKDSENRFTRLFESAPIPMAFASDADSYRATTWNEAWYRAFGYGRKEAEGKTGADIGLWVDPEDRRKFLDDTMLQSHGAEIEALLRRRDGLIRHCRVVGRFIGKPGHQTLMAIYLDITERKLAENALRESEERFSKAFRSSPAPMTISEIATSRFLDCNEKWIRLIGYSKERMIGNTAVGLGIWKDPEVRKRMVEQLCKDGFIRDYPIEVITAAAETLNVMWSVEIVNLGGSEVMLSLVYDYTDRKRAEMDKEKLQLQLVQSQKMESVGRLAGGVAHDYNNMLGVILGHAELALLKSDESNPLHRHIEEIINAAKRSAELTQQLLAFARRQTIAPRVMDLNTAVAATLQMLRWLIGENIEVVFLPGEGLCPVRIDPSQLDQILVNLCVNARDAIAGVGRISIETQEISLDDSLHSSTAHVLPGDYVLLTVNDSGFGMDKETQAKIFEPFFTTKEMGQGTGLGLATVYGIVKQNLGYINVYSEPGRGTTFRIYLPRHAGEAMEVKKTDMEEISAAHGETILMVEDEVVLLQINATMLTDLGYTVWAASTPTEAVRLGESYAGRIDLLMTDVVMPEMNGRELQQLIQQSNPGIASLFMSGYTANVISHHGVLDEGVFFIQKPFTLRDMAGKVREVLDQSRHSRKS